MCTQCAAQGAAFAVPGLVALRIWSQGRARRLSSTAGSGVVLRRDDSTKDDGRQVAIYRFERAGER